MNTRKWHWLSGAFITIFISMHLFNHGMSIFGAQSHIEWNNIFRLFYRNIIVEAVLLMSIGFQIISGIQLFLRKRKIAKKFFEKLQIWSGLYLAYFFIIHLTAVMIGRFVYNLDTNFYFGVEGLNRYPYNLFFVPYYSLAIFSFFAHIASIHAQKMKNNLLGFSPIAQSRAILMFGFVMVIYLLYALTNGFNGIDMPEGKSLIDMMK